MNRQTFLDELLRRAKEYADEAEHSDGEEYWDMHFAKEEFPAAEMVADFVIYLWHEYESNPQIQDALRQRGFRHRNEYDMQVEQTSS